MQQVLDTDPCS